MAIEHRPGSSGDMGGDTTASGYGGDSDSPETSPQPDTSEETITASLSMLGGQSVKPGDVVRMEVTQVNEDEGTFEAKYATPKPKRGGINMMADAFDKAKPKGPMNSEMM